MKKSILSLGKVMNKSEQKSVFGGVDTTGSGSRCRMTYVCNGVTYVYSCYPHIAPC